MAIDSIDGHVKPEFAWDGSAYLQQLALLAPDKKSTSIQQRFEADMAEGSRVCQNDLRKRVKAKLQASYSIDRL